MYRIEEWWCCLSPTERTVLRGMAEALPLTLFLGVPVDVWDALWFGAPGVNEDRRMQALHNYLLEIATISEDGGETEIDVVRPVDLPFWVETSLWILQPAAACLDGCSWFVFP